MKAITQNKECPVIINANIDIFTKGNTNKLVRILSILYTLGIPINLSLNSLSKLDTESKIFDQLKCGMVTRLKKCYVQQSHGA